MKDGLENIDEVFKQAFDGFEANVNPSVWTNVQNAIGSGTAAPQVEPTSTITADVATKSVVAKIATAVIAVGVVATTGYYLTSTSDKDGGKEDAAEVVLQNNNIELAEEEIVNEPEIITERQLSVQENNITRDESKEVDENVKEVKTIDKELVVNPKSTIVKTSDVVTDESSEKQNPTFVNTTEVEQVSVAEEVENSKEETKQASSGETTAVSQPKLEKQEAIVDLIPNVITPNGDGRNDVIKIEGESLEKIDLRIMDKTGKTVYRITNIEDAWNGKDQAGYDLLPGIYYMAGVVVDSAGNTKNIKQSINLLK